MTTTKKVEVQYQLEGDPQTYIRTLHDAHLPTWLASMWESIDQTRSIVIYRTFDNALVGTSF
jgi:hypothetical protein